MSNTNFTLKIRNVNSSNSSNSTFHNNNMYIFLLGLDPNGKKVSNGAGGTFSEVFSAGVFAADGTCTLKQIPSTKAKWEKTNANQFATALSDITNIDADGNLVLSIPQVNSARLYFSAHKKLSMPVTVGYKLDGTPTTLAFSEPSPFNQDDENYTTFYDKLELSFNTSGIWMNTTSVDFFTFPFSISTAYQNLSKGIPESRAKVIDAFNKYMTGVWPDLLIKVGTNDALLRVLAPQTAQGNADATKDFDADYYTPYIKAVWDYYKTNKLQVDCSEVGAGTLTGSVDQTGAFVFGSTSIPEAPTSTDLFMCSTGPFSAGNGTTLSVIVKCIAAAMNTGILPLPNHSLLKDRDFNQYFSSMYQSNPLLDGLIPSGEKGPWYNVYAQAIHSLNFNAATGFQTYAFPYDDVLANVAIHIPSLSVNDANAITLNFGDMGATKLPDESSSQKYTYNISMPADPKVSGYVMISGVKHDFKAGSNKFPNLPSPLNFYYNRGDGQGNVLITANVALDSFTPASHGSIQHPIPPPPPGTIDIGLSSSQPPNPGQKTGWGNGPYTVWFYPGAGGHGSVNGTPIDNTAKGAALPIKISNLSSGFTMKYSWELGGTEYEYTVDLMNNRIQSNNANATPQPGIGYVAFEGSSDNKTNPQIQLGGMGYKTRKT